MYNNKCLWDEDRIPKLESKDEKEDEEEER